MVRQPMVRRARACTAMAWENGQGVLYRRKHELILMGLFFLSIYYDYISITTGMIGLLK
jgi:hypothetical protein